MTHNIHHAHLVRELADMLAPVFKHSPQGVYLYLDDEHKTCNRKFATMLGYSSVKEWVANRYPVEDVVKEDQRVAIKAYMDASQKYKSSTITVTMKKKNGSKVKAGITMVPFSYNGEVFVLHFISPAK